MRPPGEVLSARLDRVRATLESLGLDALLVTGLPNLAYLTGFGGSAGVFLLTPDKAVLVSDGRYQAALDELTASGHAPSGLDVRIVRGAFEPEVASLAGALRVRRLGIESTSMPVAQWSALRGCIAAVEKSTEVIETQGIVESARIVKDAWEQGVLREAATRLSAVAAGVLADLTEGLREVEVAQALEVGMRRTGFAKPAFDTIVASGPTSALPHARAGERRLAAGDLVVVDFGGMFHGYAVDMTRTVAIGEPGPEARRIYAAVREAQAAAIDAVAPGASPEAIDRAARSVLEAHGYGPLFVHGTGHGLGLEVHEAPRVAAAGTARTVAGDGSFTVPPPARVEPGMVFTIEPGAYLPGFGGVRIEDDVLVTTGGCEVLTTGDRALRVCEAGTGAGPRHG
jgi:Xaa-Pro aminopeptidase